MSILESKRPIFFDSETLSLNPYIADADENPYNLQPMLLTTQVFAGNEMIVEKEWEIGEKKLIENLLFRLDRWAHANFKDGRFMPFVTYNGLFDVLYIIGRMVVLKFSEVEISKMSELFMSMKHIDLLQYDKGYVISLDELCNSYDILASCSKNGKDIKELYCKRQYPDIIAHGIDDVKRLYRLATETSLANRFFSDNIGIFDNRIKNKNGVIDRIALDQIPDFMKYNNSIVSFIVLNEKIENGESGNVLKTELFTGLNFESEYDVGNKIIGKVLYKDGLKVNQRWSLQSYGSLAKSLKKNNIKDTFELQNKFWDYKIEFYGDKGYCKLVPMNISEKQLEISKNGVGNGKGI